MKEVTNRKKKIATIIGVAALPLAAALSINPGVGNNSTIDVNLANVQALTQGEIDPGRLCMYAYGVCEYPDGYKVTGVFD